MRGAFLWMVCLASWAQPILSQSPLDEAVEWKGYWTFSRTVVCTDLKFKVRFGMLNDSAVAGSDSLAYWSHRPDTGDAFSYRMFIEANYVDSFLAVRHSRPGVSFPGQRHKWYIADIERLRRHGQPRKLSDIVYVRHTDVIKMLFATKRSLKDAQELVRGAVERARGGLREGYMHIAVPIEHDSASAIRMADTLYARRFLEDRDVSLVYWDTAGPLPALDSAIVADHVAMVRTEPAPLYRAINAVDSRDSSQTFGRIGDREVFLREWGDQSDTLPPPYYYVLPHALRDTVEITPVGERAVPNDPAGAVWLLVLPLFFFF